MAEQRLLFDIPSAEHCAASRLPLSHRDDPASSHEAAEHLRRSGRLAAQKAAVLAALRQCDGSTHGELGRIMGCDWLVAARRLPELERAGHVRKGEVRTCRIKGSRCTTWWIMEGAAE